MPLLKAQASRLSRSEEVSHISADLQEARLTQSFQNDVSQPNLLITMPENFTGMGTRISGLASALECASWLNSMPKPLQAVITGGDKFEEQCRTDQAY